MSLCATLWAWSLRKEIITPTEKLILLSMADRADENHECFPSKERLILDTGFKRHTVFKAIASLEAKNIIKKTGIKKGKLQRVDVYRLIGITGREEFNNANKGTNIKKTNPNSAQKGTVNSAELGTFNSAEKGIPNLSSETVIKTVCVEKQEDQTPTHNSMITSEHKEIFENRFKERIVEIEELFNDCSAYYKEVKKDMTRFRFKKWLNTEKPENYQLKNSNPSNVKETEQEKRLRYANERKQAGFE